MMPSPQDVEFPMERAELEHLLEQVNAEKAELESRLTVVARAADGLQALLEMTPAAPRWTSTADSGTGHAADAVSAGEARRVAPARRRRAKGTPRGKEAVGLILQSDTSRQWTIREVWDEQVRRRWAEPRPRGAKGNLPSRAALDRLKKDFPQNVEVTDTPVMAYQWIPDPSPSLNGFGASHAEGAVAEGAL